MRGSKGKKRSQGAGLFVPVAFRRPDDAQRGSLTNQKGAIRDDGEKRLT